MDSMLLTEPAIFFEFDPVRSVLFVLHVIIIALLTFCAGKSNLNTHFSISSKKINTPTRC